MIPEARATDDEDVSWALSTAQTSLSRGDLQEALKWLRRAAEAASEAEQDDRALELAKAVAALAEQAGASRPPPPPASAPGSAPKPLAAGVKPGPTIRGLSGGRPAAPRAPAVSPPAVSPPAVAAPATGKDDATDVLALPPPEELPATPRALPVVAREPPLRDDLAAPSTPGELEAMPTASMASRDLPDFDDGAATKVGTPDAQTLVAERGSLPIVAAARVHLVRGPDGVVRVSVAATEGSVAVLVVPVEPGTDLSKLF